MTKLQQAELSIGVALIPKPPIKNQIAQASMELTRKFENRNVIDNDRFPAHVSLYLGGFDERSISELSQVVRSAVQPSLSAKFTADRLFRSSIGFIAISCQKSPELQSLIEAVIGACGAVHRQLPRYRPSMIERWNRLPGDQQQVIAEIGAYKSAATLSPHFSVADIPQEDDAKVAMSIARKKIHLPQEFQIEEIQLVNIGHRNEQWIILDRWHL